MNRERLLELADTIENLPSVDENETITPIPSDKRAFGMNLTHHKCGTPSCIAGWTWHMYFDASPRSLFNYALVRHALDLTDEQALELFVPKNDRAIYGVSEDCIEFITAPWAAAVLRNLAETGEVDWTVGAPDLSDYRAGLAEAENGS